MLGKIKIHGILLSGSESWFCFFSTTIKLKPKTLNRKTKKMNTQNPSFIPQEDKTWYEFYLIALQYTKNSFAIFSSNGGNKEAGGDGFNKHAHTLSCSHKK